VTNEADDVKAVQPNVTFTFTAAVVIYGYMIWPFAGGTNFNVAELFADGPYTFGSSGGSLVMTPTIRVGSTIDS
jgi:hypothetical protein